MLSSINMLLVILCTSMHGYTFELGCIQDCAALQWKTPESPELTVSIVYN